MKHEPEMVFVLHEGEYIGITYEQFRHQRENDTSYKDRRFVLIQGMLMEVSDREYKAFYKDRRRQKYLKEQSVENEDFSLDMLTTDEFNGKNVLIDESQDVAEIIEQKMMIKKMKECLPLLTADEQKLIHLYFYEGISGVQLSKKYGITQQAMSKRIRKILMKIKKLMKI